MQDPRPSTPMVAPKSGLFAPFRSFSLPKTGHPAPVGPSTQRVPDHFDVEESPLFQHQPRLRRLSLQVSNPHRSAKPDPRDQHGIAWPRSAERQHQTGAPPPVIPPFLPGEHPTERHVQFSWHTKSSTTVYWPQPHLQLQDPHRAPFADPRYPPVLAYHMSSSSGSTPTNQPQRGRRESVQSNGSPQYWAPSPPSSEPSNNEARPRRAASTERTDHRQPSRPRRNSSMDREGARHTPTTTRAQSVERNGHRDLSSRSFLREIATTTIAAINNGIVDVSNLQKNTVLFLEDSKLAKWAEGGSWKRKNAVPVEVNILPFTTLQAARYLYSQNASKRIGILNFASATNPGGGFLSGARAQEESIARSSTLYVSLTTHTARPFYATHARDKKQGFYTHAMIYSPGVHLLRDDAGEWVSHHQRVDVLTCAAVNAGDVRKYSLRTRPEDIEYDIRLVLRERMGRILSLFERKGARQLVLGSFGTGVFQNDVESMARLWSELLFAPNAPFSRSFDFVAFAIPDPGTQHKFGKGFYMFQGLGGH